MNSDLRITHHFNRFVYQPQEICGLSWSPTGCYLATGANDNKVAIWDWNNSQNTENSSPVHVFDQHKAAVKVFKFVKCLFH